MRFRRLEVAVLVSLAACGGDPVATLQSNVVTINIYDFYYSPAGDHRARRHCGAVGQQRSIGTHHDQRYGDLGQRIAGCAQLRRRDWNAAAHHSSAQQSLWHADGRRDLRNHVHHSRRVRLPLFAAPAGHPSGIRGDGDCHGVGHQLAASRRQFQLLLRFLTPKQFPVAAARRDEHRVRAPLYHASLIQHDDLVGIAHRGQPVRDDDGRASVAARRGGPAGSSPRYARPPRSARRRAGRSVVPAPVRARSRRAASARRRG